MMKKLKYNNYSFLILSILLAGSLTWVGKPFSTETYTSPIVNLTAKSATLADGKEIDMNPSYGKFTIVLVRHAEKVDNSKDSKLNEDGEVRAKKLAEILKTFKADKVYSTNYIRTKDTVKPYKDKMKAVMETYDAAKQSDLLAKIKTKRVRNSLIVGHVNTIPEMINKIAKLDLKNYGEGEYDNLIVIKTDFRGKGKVHFFKY